MNEQRVIITRIDDRIVSAYMIGETIYDLLCADDKEDDVRVGDIFVGRVQNVVDNIRAAFVEIGNGTVGYLPLREEQKKIIKAEHEIIVQVKKPAKGSKDVVLTTDIELLGRYVFLKKHTLKDKGHVHISKRIKDENAVKRLEDLAETMIEIGISHTLKSDSDESGVPVVTIRTNAADADEGLIKAEFDRLFDKWKSITTHGNQRTVYSRLYREPPFFIRHINGYRSDRIDRIITDQDDIYEELCETLSEMNIEKYEDTSYPLEARYAVSTTIKKASDRLVWLKSGANLIIDKTEAMTVIDVNTAKAIEGKRASESTFFRINSEAADEVARQLRLRNLSGIILVDFIDMKEKEHVDALISRLRDRLKDDPVKAMYIDMTALGIVEITRAKKY